MKLIRIPWVLFLGFATLVSGCASATYEVKPVLQVARDTPPQNVEAQVRPGAMMMEMTKGGFFDAYELDTTIEASFMGNSCTVTPQLFMKTVQDGQYYYAISSQDYVKPSALNWQNAEWLSQCPCTLRFNPGDRKVIDVVFFVEKNGTITKVGPGSADPEKAPVLKPVQQVDIYSPDFYRKTVTFESFSDDYLYLHYKEERGQRSGYDRQNNYVAVPPKVSERMMDFDLQATKTLNVAGAEIEVVSASPGELDYKVIKPLPAD